MLRTLILAFAIVATAAWFFVPRFLGKARVAEVPTPAEVRSATAPVPAPPAPRPMAPDPLAGAARAPLKAPVKAGIPEVCVKYWNDLRGIDLAQKDRNLPTPAADCAGKMPPGLQALHQEFLQSCARGGGTPECEGSLLFYRAGITEFLTKDTPPAEISDSKVLSDKLLARMHEQNGKPLEGKAIAEVAERMLQLEPESRSAAQALLDSRIADAATPGTKPDGKTWDNLDRALDHDARTARAPEEVRQSVENRLIVDQMRNRSPEHVAESAADLARRYPQYGVGPYYGAWAESRSGNAARARELLEEAIRREPNDPRYQDALQQLQSGGGIHLQPQGAGYLVGPSE